MAAEPGTPVPLSGLDAVFSPDPFAYENVAKALDPWRQGDLVANVPLYWATRVGEDEITRLTADDPGTGSLPVVSADDPASSHFGVITSQTCDIGAGGQGCLYPTVQVCPLVRLEGSHLEKKIVDIQRGNVGYLAPISNPPAGGTWAADLRISLPVSKAVLLHQPRRSCFVREVEALQFGEHVASRYLRPALHDAISDEMVRNLRTLIESARKKHDWPDKIEQFRLHVTDGERLDPKRISIYAVTLAPLSADERKTLRSWRKGENRRLLRQAGIAVSPMLFIARTGMTAVQHRESCPLYVPELGRGAFT